MLQAHGVQLDMAQLVVIGTSGVLAALSAAAIPSAGLVTMVMVMQAGPFCSCPCCLDCCCVHFLENLLILCITMLLT